MSQKELEAQKITALPISLEEALTEMSRSELVKETFSKHVFEWFLRNKQAEIADYNAQVTQYELDHYFQRL
jgi:glutamine synthetase